LSTPQASPNRIFETLGAFRRTAALRAAIELDIFTAIAAGANTSPALGERCACAERGARILADYLSMLGFLRKEGGAYVLSPDAAGFLDRKSSSYLGADAAEALAGDSLAGAFGTLTAAVRNGGTTLAADGTLAADHPLWPSFARATAAGGAGLARLVADSLERNGATPTKVLDIAAGHGLFGIEFAKRNPTTHTFAVDWADVVAVAAEHASATGVAARFHALPGDALSVDLGEGYDLALVTNFCPDLESTTALLRRIHAALAIGGRVAICELMLDDDRTSPPAAAELNLSLLATTRSGETRTPWQLADSVGRAGFTRSELRELSPASQRLMVAWK
jgi:predicted nicotinamide N-methyase